MLRLIKYNLRLYIRNKFFMIGVGLQLFLIWYDSHYEYGFEADDHKNIMLVGIPITCLVVLCIISSIYSSGGIRNQTIIGYTRAKIFFSHILVSALVSAVLFVIIGIPVYYRHAQLEELFTALIILMAYVFVAVISACAALCFLHFFKALGAVLSVCALLVMITYPVQESLLEPKYEYKYTIDYELAKTVGLDEAETVTRKDNPLYVGDTARLFLKALAYIDPYSQIRYIDKICSFQMYKRVSALDNDEVEKQPPEGWYDGDTMHEMYNEYWCFPLITAGFAALISLACCPFFCRKDLR